MCEVMEETGFCGDVDALIRNTIYSMLLKIARSRIKFELGHLTFDPASLSL